MRRRNEVLRDFWKIVKIGFKKRFAISYSVCLSLLIFGIVPILIVKLIAFITFIVTSALYLPVFTSQFVANIRLIWSHRHRIKIPISKEIKNLTKQTGCEIKDLGLVRGETAYVCGKSLVLGIDLLKKLSFAERQAVVAHELGHIKERHNLLKALAMSSIIAVGIYSFRNFTSPIFLNEPTTQIILTIMLNLGLLAFVMMCIVPINWRLEKRADRFAAKYAGKNNIKSALSKLGTKKSRAEYSETHQSTLERIKDLEKLKE